MDELNPICDTNKAPANASQRYVFHSAAEYSVYLGVDPEIELNAFGTLREILNEPLPTGWICELTLSDHACGPGIPYFVNLGIGISQWPHPSEDIHLDMLSKLLVSAPNINSRIWRAWKRYSMLDAVALSLEKRRPDIFTGDELERQWFDVFAIIKVFLPYFNVSSGIGTDTIWLIYMAAICRVPDGWESISDIKTGQIFLKSDLSECSREHPCDKFFELVISKADVIFAPTMPADECDSDLNCNEWSRFIFYYDWVSELPVTSELISDFMDNRLSRCMSGSIDWITISNLLQTLHVGLVTRQFCLKNYRTDIMTFCASLHSILNAPQIFSCLQELRFLGNLHHESLPIVEEGVSRAVRLLKDSQRVLYGVLGACIDIITLTDTSRICQICHTLLEITECLNYSWTYADKLVLWYMRLFNISLSHLPSATLLENENALRNFLEKFEDTFLIAPETSRDWQRKHPRKRMISILRAMKFHQNAWDVTSSTSISNDLETIYMCDMKIDECILDKAINVYPVGACLVSSQTLAMFPTFALTKCGFLFSHMTNRVNSLLLEELQERDAVLGEVATKEAAILVMSLSK